MAVQKHRENLQKYKEWSDRGRVGTPPHIGKGQVGGKTCSICGCTGHLRTNKICPLYEEEEGGKKKKSRPRKTESKKNTKADGTMLTMSRSTAAGRNAKAHTKFKFTKTKMKEARQAKAEKRKRSQYMDEEYLKGPSRTTKSRARARSTAYTAWCELIETIINKLEEHECSELFKYPVPKKAAPDYYQVIKQPICLRNIRDKVGHGVSYFSVPALPYLKPLRPAVCAAAEERIHNVSTVRNGYESFGR
eukprot:SAG11_NODE_888_length_6693_cov_2.506218_4_plen_248_part_00